MNDLNYCYNSLLLLKRLEKIVYSRNECIRQFNKRQNTRSATVSFSIAFFLPFLIWINLLFFSDGINVIFTLRDGIRTLIMRILSLVMISLLIFTLIYFVTLHFWKNTSTPMKKRLERNLRIILVDEINTIDDESKAILSQKELSYSRIPEEYLTSEMLHILIRYFESGQAISLREALYSLDLEIKNTGHYKNLITDDTLLQKEQRYFLSEKENLKKRILVEGEV